MTKLINNYKDLFAEANLPTLLTSVLNASKECEDERTKESNSLNKIKREEEKFQTLKDQNDVIIQNEHAVINDFMSQANRLIERARTYVLKDNSYCQ